MHRMASQRSIGPAAPHRPAEWIARGDSALYSFPMALRPHRRPSGVRPLISAGGGAGLHWNNSNVHVVPGEFVKR